MQFRAVALAAGLIIVLTLPAGGLLQTFGQTKSFPKDDKNVVISAVYYDAYDYFDAGEALALHNYGEVAVEIGGWYLSDGVVEAILPPGSSVNAHGEVWVTADAAAFARQFGFEPHLVVTKWPGFANDGDEVLLLDDQHRLVDTVVYESGSTTTTGWYGDAVQPYTVRGVFGQEGQILYRQLDPSTGRPLPDTDRASDWAQTSGDPAHGRRARYPGWNLEKFFFLVEGTETADLTVAVAPDNAYHAIRSLIDEARSSLLVASLTFENLALGDALVAAAERGVEVSLLLEGGPVGGIDDHEKAICRDLETAGGHCWFMISNAEDDIFDRYQYMHGKYMVIDGTIAIVSSENFGPASLPYDEKSDGTWGRRGIVLITRAPAIVRGLENVFNDDLDPVSHQDIFRWRSGDPTYGLPQGGYGSIQASGGITYTVRFPQAKTFSDASYFALQQSPENMLRDTDGVMGLIGRAGAGDTLLVQQLQERPYWGLSNSDPAVDPNLRLEALLAAARRGARVRLMLDSHFDQTTSMVSNAATCARLESIARSERLQLACTTANPTGLGIHGKMILGHINGRGYVHVGSWNGTELSSKGNREVALLVQSDSAYSYLADLFERDWPHVVYLPLFLSNYRGPGDIPLISEIMYDPHGPDDAEFIEIVNPTSLPMELSDWSIGDAVSPDDFEDVRRFPEGTFLLANGVLVVATTGRAFFDEHGFWPDYEILDTVPIVPNLIDDPDWGDSEALLRLGNQGDEVLLRDVSGNVVDAVNYGTGSFGEQPACPLVIASNHSLERIPYWHDTDSCPADFREWPFPSPGKLP